MVNYWYRGRSQNLEIVRGYLKANDHGQAWQQLTDQGIWVTDLIECHWWWVGVSHYRKKKLKIKFLAPCIRQLAFALASGMTLLDCLKLMNGSSPNESINLLLCTLLQQIQQGRNLYDALNESLWQIPAMMLELVAIGEKRGQLDRTMSACADYLEHEITMKREAITALIYPLIVLFIMILAMVIMFIFVVPMLITTYDNYEIPLPLATQFVLAISQGFQDQWLVILFGNVLFGALIWRGFHWGLAEPDRRIKLVRCLERIPIINGLIKQYMFIQFTYGLGQLLDGGILLLNSLTLLVKQQRYVLYQDQILQIINRTMAGQSFYQSIAQCSFFPAIGRQMIMVAEESGKLGEMLLTLSCYYKEQANQYILRLSKLVEPLLILLLGAMVLLIITSLFLPIISSYQYMV